MGSTDSRPVRGAAGCVVTRVAARAFGTAQPGAVLPADRGDAVTGEHHSSAADQRNGYCRCADGGCERCGYCDRGCYVREGGGRRCGAEGGGEYRFRAKDVRALTPAQRRWFAEWDARMAASNARCARRVESIADLNPEIAARNARLHAWANGWRKSQVAAEPVPLVNVKRQGTVRVVEGVAADGTRIVADPLAPSRGRKPTWYVRRGDALVRVA